MKSKYKIGEIAKIFNISTDTLRFYEKEGLLVAKRESNGYRVYSIFDVWKLNVIKTLKSLGVGLKDIKEFLNNRSVENEKFLLEMELDFIEKELASLHYQKKELTNRIQLLEDASQNTYYNQVRLEFIEERKVLYLDYEFSTDNEVDLAFSSLSKKFKEVIHFFNRDFGMILPLDKIKNKQFNHYKSGFLVVRDGLGFDAIIPSGYFLILRHHGPYADIEKSYRQILQAAQEQQLKLKDAAIEKYLIDINQTSNPEEYLTEIQLAVDI